MKSFLNFDDIGERIRELREEKHFTRKRLSELTELSESQIKKIEYGERKVSLRSFIDLQTALKTTQDYLLWGKSEKTSKEKIKELIYQLPVSEKDELFHELLTDILNHNS